MDRLDKTSVSYGVEVSAERSKLMKDNTNGITEEISANGQREDTVSSRKYLDSVVANERSEPEIIFRMM